MLYLPRREFRRSPAMRGTSAAAAANAANAAAAGADGMRYTRGVAGWPATSRFLPAAIR